MNEFFARERLSAYIDGELSASERGEVDAALKRSPELREEYERLLTTVDFVREHGPAQAPPGFHARLMAQVADEPMPGGLWLKIRGFFTALPMESLAVAVAAILVAVLVGRKMDDPPPVPVSEPVQIAEVAEPEEAPERTAEITPEPEVVAATKTKPITTSKKDAPSGWAEEMAGVVLGGEAPKDDRAASVGTTKVAPDDGIVQLDTTSSAPAAEAKDVALDPERHTELEAGQSMQLHVTDPDSLRQLLNIVYRFDGTVTDANGRQVDEDALINGASKIGLRILLPQENVTRFAMALQQLGEVHSTSYNDKMLYSAEQKVGVYVEVIAPVSKK
ncbi:MAG TPA: zf-HC2 domain-containing protein [Myxococcota bacterium]|nr:zf-HC2 domain-containing protein [Myxococcota bacterium]